MKKKSAKLSLFIAILFISAFFGSSALAATVGDRLTAPESGWKRIDNIDPNFKLEGVWSYGSGSSYTDRYNMTQLYSGDVNGKLKFVFYGTKLRIIDVYMHLRSKEMSVEIDGVTETYSAYTSSTTPLYQRIVYEKLNLPLGFHSVVISNSSGQDTMSLDAIDIDSTGYLLSIEAPANLTAVPGAAKVDLQWTSVTGATGYYVKRSTVAGGPYEVIATVTDAVYTDTTVVNGTTYYYVVTAKETNSETANSNEVSATPQGNEVNRALLTVTLDTGLQKEFDLSMSEVEAFLAWYEAKAAGSGPATFALNKHENNKGPFSSRKDYIIYQKVLTFEVNEYILPE